MERGNLSSRCEGSGVKQKTCKRLSTDAGHKGRWLRSSDETSEMNVERRGQSLGLYYRSTAQVGGTGEPAQTVCVIQTGSMESVQEGKSQQR
ncbi:MULTISPECIES: hypothetical protein [Photorhabdus]|uniref:hypothetical protein n=1 Tax=Photorhabdus TaxID=29487 RepID=UPI0008FFB1EE|nr:MULTISPECIES: hypothetical protein [Photorhabdus]NDK93534.1 hypothetical protein [Photorhabdus laumondii subsp. laumondii]NDL46407.1 hypothetical protein [Photorhabdus laumondii subsp. laumondii]